MWLVTHVGQKYSGNNILINKILDAVVVGGGPAGLMAASRMAAAGKQVAVFDAMPSVGRKFLRAGVGGLNLTHSEAFEPFTSRYQPDMPVTGWLRDFDADRVRAWAAELGIETYIGSSGRVFPVQQKASPLLRAWLGQLRTQGVEFFTRHRWLGWTSLLDDNGFVMQAHRFLTPHGEIVIYSRCTVLALGGGSWSRLGSDGQWLPILSDKALACQPLTASNCGFDICWSKHIQEQFAGTPLKSVTLNIHDPETGKNLFSRRGEAMVAKHGIQGSLVYAASRIVNQLIQRTGSVTFYWDLLPDLGEQTILQRISVPQGKESRSNFLRKRLGLTGLKLALLYEFAQGHMQSPDKLAAVIKSLPITVSTARPVDEAISTAGGLCLSELDEGLMLRKFPGVFCAGEMLDWDAPTGGYLLTACFASGNCAGNAAVRYLDEQKKVN